MLHIRRDEHELIAKALLQLWKSLETALREINRLAEGEKEFSAEESCFRMAAKIVRALCRGASIDRRPPSAREEALKEAINIVERAWLDKRPKSSLTTRARIEGNNFTITQILSDLRALAGGKQ
jgi:hypothetical protein